MVSETETTFPPLEALEGIEATPALVVDLPTATRNIARLADYAKANGLGVRPHTKTHKSLRVARLQMEHGAIGLTAAKAGEAVGMAAVSKDILVAYPAVDTYRARVLAELAREATVTVALDGPAGAPVLDAAAKKAGSTIRVLVDLDIGFHRTGVQSPAAAAELAKQIDSFGSLAVNGLFFYPGHVWLPADQQAAELARIDALVAEALYGFKRAGLSTAVVSGGSTPTAYQSHLMPTLTEIRPGTYPYNDMNTVRGGYCTLDDVAARIVCTVVSDAVPGKVVIDAGTKTLTSDRNAADPANGGFGHVVEYPDATVLRLSEEHGELDVSRSARRPRVGERVSVIPNHICPCVNLRDEVWLRHGDGHVEAMRIDTRGKLS